MSSMINWIHKPVTAGGARQHRRANTRSLFCLVIPVLFLSGQPGMAQERNERETDQIHPLSLKEGMIRDRFKRFEDRLFRLRQQLSEAEPDNAARLQRVLEKAGEFGLEDQLDQLVDLFNNPSSLDRSMDMQADWLAKADRLLSILLERDSDNQERRSEIERLQKYNEKLNKILGQERTLRQATGQTGLTGRMLEQLQQAIRRVDNLLNQQKEISKATPSPSPSPSAVQDRQSALARDAEQLSKELKQLAQRKPQESSHTPSLQSAREKIQEAAQSTQSGSQEMSKASQDMKGGKASSARKQQEKASEALRRARKQLEEAKQKLQEQADSEKLAQQQERISESTGKLSDQMKQDAQQNGGGQGKQGGQQGSSKQTPGQRSLDKAQQEMNDATQSLQKEQTNEATESEDQAIEELEQAQKELDEALSQLRKEEKEETLRDLESRFREMLVKQRGINEATVQLDDIGRENFKRAERLQLADLASQQRTLSQDAASCLNILNEDGTTVVFPHVVEQISEDMTMVAQRLGVFKVAVLTQTIEEGIVDALEQLLESVQKMQQENEQQGAPMAGEPGESPLLPKSAELKLLRASQVRINTRTAAIESERTHSSQLDDSLSRALHVVAARQVETAKVAREMRDRQQQR